MKNPQIFPFKLIVLYIILSATGGLGTFSLADDTAPSDVPQWVKRRPEDSSGYKFYVGRSSPQTDELKAHAEAASDAYNQANSENFGVTTSGSTVTTETIDSADLEKTIHARTSEAILVQFTPKETFFQRKEDKVIAYVLYQYPIEEIRREKKRLAVQEKEERKRQAKVSQVGEVSDSESGSVRINTVPAGATVKIDHITRGRTPVQINGLELGEHSVDVSLENYKSVLNQGIIVTAGSVKSLNLSLVHKTTAIQFNSNPEGAVVSVNGRPVDGVTPTTFMANVGEVINVTINHPEAFPESRQIATYEGGQIESFELRYKPAKMMLDTDPSKAVIFVNNEQRGITGDEKPIRVDRGEYSIRFSKSGYKDKEIAVTVKGGETKIVPTQSLELLPDPEKKRIREYLLEKERESRERMEVEAQNRKMSEEFKKHDSASNGKPVQDAVISESDRKDFRRAVYEEAVEDILYKRWKFMAGIGFNNGSVKVYPTRSGSSFSCCGTVDVAGQYRVYHMVSARISYGVGFGMSSAGSSTQTYIMHDFSFGAPVTLQQDLSIGPELSHLITTSNMGGISFRQTGFGLYASYDFPGLIFGQNVIGALKIRKYGDPSVAVGLEAGYSFSISAGIYFTP